MNEAKETQLDLFLHFIDAAEFEYTKSEITHHPSVIKSTEIAFCPNYEPTLDPANMNRFFRVCFDQSGKCTSMYML